MMEVGCEDDDGLLIVHDEEDRCEVCAATVHGIAFGGTSILADGHVGSHVRGNWMIYDSGVPCHLLYKPFGDMHLWRLGGFIPGAPWKDIPGIRRRDAPLLGDVMLPPRPTTPPDPATGPDEGR